MRHHEDGGIELLVEHLEALEQQFCVLGVQSARGLVGKHELGLADHGAGRCHALTLTARHLIGKLVENPLDAQGRCHGHNACRNLARRHAPDGKGQRYVLATGERVEQVGVLEDEAEFLTAKVCQGARLQLCHVLPIDKDRSRGRGVDGGDAVEQRGLARA